jgi:membrane-associated protease RseP (regulator of RpoE activity)
MLMDTGAGLHFLLEEDSHPTIMMPDSVLDGRIGSGLGGNLGGFLGNVAEFDLLNDEFRNIPVYFHRKDTSYLALLLDKQRNGIIGNIYWQNFKLVLDYSSQTLYMKPYRRKLKKFRFNKSGLVIFAVGRDFEEFIIKHVTPGSPADEAGLQSGDIVKSFNKIPISYLSLGQVNKRLSGNEGDKIKIKISLLISMVNKHSKLL